MSRRRDVLRVDRSELDETSGSRNLSRISQQPTRIKTLAEVAKANAEIKRVERLKREIDTQIQKFNADKARFRTAQRAWEEEKRAMQQQLKRKANHITRTSSLAAQNSLREDQLEAAELRKKLNQTLKQNRILRRKVGELEQDIGRSEKRSRATLNQRNVAETESDRIRQMRRDVERLKANLKKATNQVNEEKQWYRAATRRIKRKQDQWFREQRLALTESGQAIKYMFVDDVKRIKIYSATNHVAVVGSGGEAMLDGSVRVRNVDGSETAPQETPVEGEAGARRAAVDFSALLQELGKMGADDDKEDHEEESNLADARDIISEMVNELDARSRDLASLYEVVIEGDVQDFAETATSIEERQQDVIEFLRTAFESEDFESVINDLTTACHGYTTNLNELLPYLQRSQDKATFGRDEVQQELSDRIQDVIKRTSVGSEMDTEHMLSQLSSWEMEVLERHRTQSEQLRAINEEQKDDDAHEQGSAFLDSLELDYENWRLALKSVSTLAQKKKSLDTRCDVFQSELGDHVRDLTSVKEIREDDDPDAVQDQTVELIEAISNRHGTNESTFSQTEGAGNGEVVSAFETSNSDYRAIITALLDTGGQSEVKQQDGVWWLAQDVYRTERLAEIGSAQDPTECGHLIAFLERLLGDDLDLSTVYIPMHQHVDQYGEAFVLLASCLDGVLLVTMLNKLQDNMVDVRALHRPDPFHLAPLSHQQIKENVALLISTIHAENIEFPSGTKVVDWFDNMKYPFLLFNLIREIGRQFINRLVDVGAIPQLIRLVSESEDPHRARMLTGFDFTLRWVNNQGGRPFTEEINDWNTALCHVVASVNSGFNAREMIELGGHDQASEVIVAVKRMGVQTIISAGDLSHNNLLCQQYLAAEILAAKPGLEPLSDEEKERYKALMYDHPGDLEDNMYAGWINSMGIENVHIQNLEEDLSDGIVLLKIIDRVKPVVKWRRKVVMEPTNKFQALENCTYALLLARSEFSIPTHNMEANDIVQGNEKTIHSLLWFIMRFNATQTLSQLEFGGQEVTDEQILNWANSACSKLDYKFSRSIRGFRDKSLTTGLFYLDLLRAVAPSAVNEDLVYDSIPALDTKKKTVVDEYAAERMANVRYAMTIIRLLGEDLFVIPDHVLQVDSHACLSMLCAIMLIDVKKKLDGSHPGSPIERKSTFHEFMEDVGDALTALE